VKKVDRTGRRFRDPFCPTHGRWTTEDEIAFVQGLGHYLDHMKAVDGYALREPRKDRLALLFEYQASIARRSDWGEVDPVQIEDEVRAQINGGLDRPIRAASTGRAGGRW